MQFSEQTRSKYERLDKLGEGTYADVFRARIRSPMPAGLHDTTGAGAKGAADQHRDLTSDKAKVEFVAIKRIKLASGPYLADGVDMSAIREIKFLHELRHPNIIRLYDIFVHKQNVHLVLEYLDSDLEHIIKDKSVVFGAGDIKSWLLQTLRGLEHCHRSWVLHRDLKPNNLLLSAVDGTLKLADFGLARFYGEPLGNMTSQVVTRWYRCPELLFGSRDYGEGVDMWAVGCIFAELMLRTPFMVGDTDMDQLKTIFRALGTPTESEWPNHSKLPNFVSFTVYPRTPLRSLFTAASDNALDLLEQMLRYDPNKRINAEQALLHPYFAEYPYPTHPSKLPRVSTPAANAANIDEKPHHHHEEQEQLRSSKPTDRGGKRKAPTGADNHTRKTARKLDFNQ